LIAICNSWVPKGALLLKPNPYRHSLPLRNGPRIPQYSAKNGQRWIFQFPGVQFHDALRRQHQGSGGDQPANYITGNLI
jgi:hypothetical protein